MNIQEIEKLVKFKIKETKQGSYECIACDGNGQYQILTGYNNSDVDIEFCPECDGLGYFDWLDVLTGSILNNKKSHHLK